MHSQIQPVTSQGRIQLLDLLRGFALFGILMVNMPLFNNPHTIMFGNYSIWTDETSQQALWFIRFLFEGKFYILFSLLFGMGFQLFLQKADENGLLLKTYRRRLLILLLIGALHVVLLWVGDILVWYALFGLLMTVFRKKSNRTLLKWSIGFLSIPIVLTFLMLLMGFISGNIPEAAEQMAESFKQQHQFRQQISAQAYETYATGTFTQIVAFRLLEYSQLLPGLFFFYPNTIAMFLLGMVFIRKGYIIQPEAHATFYRRMLAIGLPIGLLGSFAMAQIIKGTDPTQLSWLALLQMAGHSIGGVFLGLSYMCLIAFWMQKQILQALKHAIGCAGRMALSNYLMQSVIVTTLAFSYGFGLYGKISPLHGIFLTVLIYVFQLFFSVIWLSKFKYGPMEWLWRSLTYGRKFALKKE